MFSPRRVIILALAIGVGLWYRPFPTTRNSDVAKISFTGSVAVGQGIMRDGAETMRRAVNRAPVID